MSELEQARDRLASLVMQNDWKVVFAESCTGGLVAATMAQVSGISNHLCGSAVTYRAATKQLWLQIQSSTIDEHTTESRQVAEEMVLNVLKNTLEADWAASIVGHFEGEAFVWISIARRTSADRLLTLESSCERHLQATTRIPRQQEAAALVLNYLADHVEKAIV